MTPAQKEALIDLCERYGVTFTESDYEVAPFDLPPGYVAGWVGGALTARRTIYVGVSPEGEVSS